MVVEGEGEHWERSYWQYNTYRGMFILSSSVLYVFAAMLAQFGEWSEGLPPKSRTLGRCRRLIAAADLIQSPLFVS